MECLCLCNILWYERKIYFHWSLWLNNVFYYAKCLCTHFNKRSWFNQTKSKNNKYPCNLFFFSLWNEGPIFSSLSALAEANLVKFLILKSCIHCLSHSVTLLCFLDSSCAWSISSSSAKSTLLTSKYFETHHWTFLLLFSKTNLLK